MPDAGCRKRTPTRRRAVDLCGASATWSTSTPKADMWKDLRLPTGSAAPAQTSPYRSRGGRRAPDPDRRRCDAGELPRARGGRDVHHADHVTHSGSRPTTTRFPTASSPGHVLRASVSSTGVQDGNLEEPDVPHLYSPASSAERRPDDGVPADLGECAGTRGVAAARSAGRRPG